MVMMMAIGMRVTIISTATSDITTSGDSDAEHADSEIDESSGEWLRRKR